MRLTLTSVVVCVALATSISAADARCGRSYYNIFVHGFESARDRMRTKPHGAYNAFINLRQRAENCGRGEDRADVRYKLQLFEIGLQGYIGAADAERGNVARGRATAQSAMTQALALRQAHRAKPADLRLADELVAQLKTPLQIIDDLQSPAPSPKG